MGFRGEKFACRNLKRTNFSRSNPALHPFHGSRFIPPDLHTRLQMLFGTPPSPLLFHPSFPRLLFHLPRPSFISPLLPLPCEKCPKVSNNVTRISKLGSILETLFIFFFFFSFLSFFFSIQIYRVQTLDTRVTDYKSLCTLSRGGNYWNELCVVMTRLEMKFNWPDEKQKHAWLCARVRGTCVMIVTDRENSFAASCNFSSSSFPLYLLKI